MAGVADGNHAAGLGHDAYGDALPITVLSLSSALAVAKDDIEVQDIRLRVRTDLASQARPAARAELAAAAWYRAAIAAAAGTRQVAVKHADEARERSAAAARARAIAEAIAAKVTGKAAAPAAAAGAAAVGAAAGVAAAVQAAVGIASSAPDVVLGLAAAAALEVATARAAAATAVAAARAADAAASAAARAIAAIAAAGVSPARRAAAAAANARAAAGAAYKAALAAEAEAEATAAIANPPYEGGDFDGDGPRRLKSRLRQEVVLWLLQVAVAVGLELSTCAVAVGIVDRFVEVTPDVPHLNLIQLLALASLRLADKLEESDRGRVIAHEQAQMGTAQVSQLKGLPHKEWHRLTSEPGVAFIYGPPDLTRMESNICGKLRWSLSAPTVERFVRHFLICLRRRPVGPATPSGNGGAAGAAAAAGGAASPASPVSPVQKRRREEDGSAAAAAAGLPSTAQKRRRQDAANAAAGSAAASVPQASPTSSPLPAPVAGMYDDLTAAGGAVNTRVSVATAGPSSAAAAAAPAVPAYGENGVPEAAASLGATGSGPTAYAADGAGGGAGAGPSGSGAGPSAGVSSAAGVCATPAWFDGTLACAEPSRAPWTEAAAPSTSGPGAAAAAAAAALQSPPQPPQPGAMPALAGTLDRVAFTLAELTLIYSDYLAYRPSTLALACVALAAHLTTASAAAAVGVAAAAGAAADGAAAAAAVAAALALPMEELAPALRDCIHDIARRALPVNGLLVATELMQALNALN